MSDDPITSTVKTTVDAVEGILEKTPIYQDLLQPGVRQIGEGLEAMLRLMVTPFLLLNYVSNANLQEFKDGFDRKSASIPEERVIPPNLTVVGPILQSLGYTVHEAPLREMFTSLLVTAMDSQTAQLAHPAYAEIIKQLSPDEARILAYSHKIGMSHAIAHVKRYTRGKSISPSFTYVTRNLSNIAIDAGCTNPELSGTYISNLERLGLYELANFIYEDKSWYEWIDKRFSEIKPLLGGDDFADIEYGAMRPTDLGISFAQACIATASIL
jgi:hypothetical protein